MMEMLSHIKMQRGRDDALGVDASIRLATILLTIVLVVTSKNMMFAYVVGAALLVRLALMPGEQIISVLKPVLGAVLFSALVMLPAVFMGQPSALIRISTKVFISVTLLAVLSRTARWTNIVGALRTFHLPSIFVLTIDTALKFIVLLGEVALEVLDAITLRSVGHNIQKSSAVSGVLGVTFIKAQGMSQEMYYAMECRGFQGEYVFPRKRIWTRRGLLYLAIPVLAILVFLYLEGII